MSSFMGGRFTLNSISLADLSPSQTRWLGMVEAGHLLPSRKERRPACKILGGGTPVIHRSAWRGCMKRAQVRANRLVMRRIIAAYTNASPLAHDLS